MRTAGFFLGPDYIRLLAIARKRAPTGRVNTCRSGFSRDVLVRPCIHVS